MNYYTLTASAICTCSNVLAHFEPGPPPTIAHWHIGLSGMTMQLRGDRVTIQARCIECHRLALLILPTPPDP
jgi:hypothetical protein